MNIFFTMITLFALLTSGYAVATEKPPTSKANRTDIFWYIDDSSLSHLSCEDLKRILNPQDLIKEFKSLDDSRQNLQSLEDLIELRKLRYQTGTILHSDCVLY